MHGLFLGYAAFLCFPLRRSRYYLYTYTMWVWVWVVDGGTWALNVDMGREHGLGWVVYWPRLGSELGSEWTLWRGLLSILWSGLAWPAWFGLGVGGGVIVHT